jgi:glucokinase
MNCYAGLDLGGTALKYGYGNNKSGLLFFERKLHHNQGKEEVFKLLTAAIHDIKNRLQKDEILRAIALGSPGYIDVRKGEVLYNSPNLKDWTSAKPCKILEKAFSVPVFIENDANLMAYGEAKTRGSNSDSCLGITIGTGIGSGFVLNDRIYHGDSYSAMEIGHTIIRNKGRRCGCGKYGCLEMYSSVSAIKKQAARLLPEPFEMEDLLSLQNSDERIRSIINQAYDKLGFAIANAVTLLDPRLVIIGGGLTECKSFSLSQLIPCITQYLNNYQINNLKIEQASLKNRAGVWGGILRAESLYSGQ